LAPCWCYCYSLNCKREVLCALGGTRTADVERAFLLACGLPWRLLPQRKPKGYSSNGAFFALRPFASLPTMLHTETLDPMFAYGPMVYGLVDDVRRRDMYVRCPYPRTTC
ncbi:unnamed protein product, partial [Ectocarpus sp. 8 AP-2014]